MRQPGKALSLTLALLIAVVGDLPSAANSKGKFPGVGSRAIWRKAVVFYNEAAKTDQDKKWAESAALYQKAIDLYPHDAVFFAGLGASSMEIPLAAQAERALLEAIRLEPDFQQPWFNLGVVYFNTKKPAQAKKAFQKALTLTTSEPEKREIAEYLRKLSTMK